MLEWSPSFGRGEKENREKNRKQRGKERKKAQRTRRLRVEK